MKSSALAPKQAASTASPAPARSVSPTRALAAANDGPLADRQRAKEPPGPLWVIAIAMGAFFGATALMMMFD